MTKKQHQADLECKVKVLLKNIENLGLDRLKKLQLLGVDIVSDHTANEDNWITPRNFICALAEEIAFQYGMGSLSRETKKCIKNYALMM